MDQIAHHLPCRYCSLNRYIITMSAGGPVVSNSETPSLSNDGNEKQYHGYADAAVEHGDGDPFGSEEFSEVKYKTMEWW